VTDELSSGDRVVREAEELRRKLLSTASDLMTLADLLQTEVKVRRGATGGEGEDGERRPEG